MSFSARFSPLTARLALCAAAVASWPVVAHAQRPGQAPVGQAAPNDQIRSPEANEIEVVERRGERLDANLKFIDQDGREVRLGDFFDGERPVLLTMNYYRCPVLCNVQLNQLTETLRELDWVPGEHFRIVTVSIDPREGPDLAAKKRANHLESLAKGDVDWNFLTGKALDIRLLAGQVGMGYAYDGEQDQYAHPPVVVFATPDGVISGYEYGLAYEADQVKEALMVAADGKIGSAAEQFFFSCFHYDPSIGEYSEEAMDFMRLGGFAVVLVVGSFLFVVWRRERRRHPHELEARA